MTIFFFVDAFVRIRSRLLVLTVLRNNGKLILCLSCFLLTIPKLIPEIKTNKDKELKLETVETSFGFYFTNVVCRSSKVQTTKSLFLSGLCYSLLLTIFTLAQFCARNFMLIKCFNYCLHKRQSFLLVENFELISFF